MLLLTVHDGDVGTSEQGDAVEEALGPDLLHRADQHIEERHADRGRLPQQDQGQSQSDHDDVDVST